MNEEDISARELSKKIGYSTSVIQNLRSMKPTTITMKTMTALLKPLGYHLTAIKGKGNEGIMQPAKETYADKKG